MLAVRSDDELNKLLGNADFANAGVPSNLNAALFSRGGKKGKKGKKIDEVEEENLHGDA
jgi:hypothetical protein